MSHLDSWRPTEPYNQGFVQEIREDLSRHFWMWYEANKDDVLAEVRILFWSKKVYVRDLRALFVMLFGER